MAYAIHHDYLVGVHQDVNTTASPQFVGATLSGLTATRVLFAGAGGVISNSGNLTYDGTNLTVTGGNAVAAGFVTPNTTYGSSVIIYNSNLHLNSGKGDYDTYIWGTDITNPVIMFDAGTNRFCINGLNPRFSFAAIIFPLS